MSGDTNTTSIVRIVLQPSAANPVPNFNKNQQKSTMPLSKRVEFTGPDERNPHKILNSLAPERSYKEIVERFST